MKDRISITMLDGGIADVRLIRADKMNALDPAMWAALTEAIDTLKAMSGLRVVVLSGEGRAFCAGLDLASLGGERDPGTSSTGGSLNERAHGIANGPQYAAWGWRELPVPVIAAVHGVAFGAGSQIMAAADIRIVHPDTRIAIMEMRWGLVPDVAGMALWRTQVADDVLRGDRRQESACDPRRQAAVQHAGRCDRRRDFAGRKRRAGEGHPDPEPDGGGDGGDAEAEAEFRGLARRPR